MPTEKKTSPSQMQTQPQSQAQSLSQAQTQSQTQSQSQTQREVILVNILERLSNQIQQFDTRLESIEKNQLALPRLMEHANSQQGVNTAYGNDAISRLQESMQRYRSDMLSLVNQQDRLDERLKDLHKRQDAIIGAQEVISRDAARLDERFSIQEKAVSEHSTFSVRQGENFSKEIDSVNRNTAKLYLDADKKLEELSKEIEGVNKNSAKLFLDAEKRLGSIPKEIEGVNRNANKLYVDTEKRLENILHEIANVDRNANKIYVDTAKNLKDEGRETQKQLDELRRETMRRLLALDKIESTLEILMIRTEPQEKKPFILVRGFRAVGVFFTVHIPNLFKKIGRGLRNLRKV